MLHSFGRFRSADRDQKTDVVRREKLIAAVQKTVREVERELEGVKSRYDAAETAAFFLCGNDVTDAESRDCEAERDLKIAETNLVNAELRIQQLTRQHEELRKLELQSRRAFDDRVED